MTANSKSLVSPCAEHEENLVMFHYGDLDSGASATLQAHLGACAPCASYLKGLETLLPLTLETDRPPEVFWTDYNRELRRKLDQASEKKSWMRSLGDFFQPRWIPALGTAAAVALALAVTLSRDIWRAQPPSQQEAAIMEMLPVAEHLEFFKTMDVLDSLDLLESMGAQSNAA
jgi:hypothetical protein